MTEEEVDELMKGQEDSNGCINYEGRCKSSAPSAFSMPREQLLFSKVFPEVTFAAPSH